MSARRLRLSPDALWHSGVAQEHCSNKETLRDSRLVTPQPKGTPPLEGPPIASDLVPGRTVCRGRGTARFNGTDTQ
ncbi:hypothetical protein GCM10010387_65610 [Streptomyces inusitatus]|uniref:Uncharacterized protein n=1 Tax=Streptomyces inusitatus TaxID=68221 RepID=A0A918QQC7_9ACTN|nr:hypothetical protein GCM10010387_65610 [Streptomyces inusitatus]